MAEEFLGGLLASGTTSALVFGSHFASAMDELFPLRRYVGHDIGVALGFDVGAGTGLFLPKEALQAYIVQRMLGQDGMNLTPVHLLYLATRAGARALGLDDRAATSR